MSHRFLFVTKHRRVGVAALITSFGFMAGMGMVFSGTGCGGGLGGECISTGDCKADLICAFHFCTKQCTDSSECAGAVDPDATCVLATGDDIAPDSLEAEVNVCQKPTECSDIGGACASGQRCGFDNKCGRDCTAPPQQCPGTDVCFQGTCRSSSNPPDGGWHAAAENDVPCNVDSDCKSLNCNKQGVCASCSLDMDCDVPGMLYCDCSNIPTGQCVTEKPVKSCKELGAAGSSSGMGGAGGAAGSGSGTGGAGGVGSSSSSGGMGGAGGAGNCHNLPNTPMTCGNGTVDAFEECDDGNCVASDACNNNCKNPYCGDGIVQFPETCDGGEGCQSDCNPIVIPDAGPEAGLCEGKEVFVGLLPATNGAFSGGGQFGIDAANALCQGMGAVQMCDYVQWKQIETNPMMYPTSIMNLGLTIPDGTCQAVWLQRTTDALASACPGGMSSPGPGGRCNNWNDPMDDKSDGEFVDVCNLGGAITYNYHIDCDTIYEFMNPAPHQDPTLPCSMPRPIPCCYKTCIP